jgi:adenine/guanine phosphoribosyltransferase-like PRPP-binding protein
VKQEVSQVTKKAFYRSKAFYGCVSTIVLIVGDIAANGATIGNMMALMTAGFALYGRIVATAPLAISDQSETDVEDAKADVRKSKVPVDADHGN